jgi:hypothetical protein
VRIGGSPYLNTPFRWGYGWPFGRGYKALTAAEMEQVKRLQANIKLPEIKGAGK